mmetsp:Transcript_112862/g.299824  ORF Transcript_112862/g.299824 Transcript_112862/m.299824 type:complete len:218 (+) Transcript_112862:996-1649(+)
MPRAQTSALPSAKPSSCSGAKQQMLPWRSLKSFDVRRDVACDGGVRGCEALGCSGFDPCLPQAALALARRRPYLLAKPKSIIFSFMSRTEVSAFTGDSKSQFSGRMSLCTTACSCRWATAPAICLTRPATVPSLKLPTLSQMLMRSPPWQRSMTRYTLVVSSTASWSLQTCGWSILRMVPTSSLHPLLWRFLLLIRFTARKVLPSRHRILTTTPREL